MSLSRVRSEAPPLARTPLDRPTRRRVCTLAAATAAAAILGPAPVRAAPGSRPFEVGGPSALAVSDGWLDLPVAAFPNLDDHATAPAIDPVRVGTFG